MIGCDEWGASENKKGRLPRRKRVVPVRNLKRGIPGRANNIYRNNLSPCRAKVKTGNRGSFDIFLHFCMVLARLRDREHGIAANPAGFYPYLPVDVDTGSGYMHLIHILRYSTNHIFQRIDDTNSC